ncbi:SDR family NAD(P)-dependent oxidoreductase [Nocardia spumae]|uniref:SDR family NAD(P)-dependent oxidoreductase n=1 Tax=Nocardia spumae TaxID=2887190 RepID=UPI001D138C4D|nr:SDR family NAD(P)-dependent oxidoreductase [Nocardia spumae]
MAAEPNENIDPHRYGPWAVIAGGSEGVGAEFADRLAAAGIDIVLLARREGPLAETAERIRARGARVRTLAVDLTASDAAEKVAAATADIEVGLLIFNAGANTHSAEFLDGDLDAFAAMNALNVTTPLALVHHFGRGMRERRRGGIVLVGSLTGYSGSARHTVYGGSKAYLRIFAESLWLELRDHQVDVLHLVLGVTRTPAMARAGLNFDIPGMRVAEPADVAREGLAHLADGPVFVAGGNAETAARSSGPDRAAIVLGGHRRMRKLLGLPGDRP